MPCENCLRISAHCPEVLDGPVFLLSVDLDDRYVDITVSRDFLIGLGEWGDGRRVDSLRAGEPPDIANDACAD